MRTKHFYLCLLLLVLGTANVWADKYYQPWSYKGDSNPRFADLAGMVGQKFMIYNATINGNEDRTGFLYNNGASFALDKTKERDLFIYNEKYVYTLEEATDANGVACYAIKSVTSGTYVAADGSTAHSTPQYLYIKDWKSAGDADWARSGANAENYKYSVIANGNIASNGNVNAFVVSSSDVHVPRYDADGNENANYTIYWNGTVSDFTTWSDGHPYAFYRVSEIQDGGYLEDLHIFSRSDIYSAQVIWGYVQNASNITVSPNSNPAANTVLLIDGDLTTGVSTVAGTGSHYFQFNLGKETSEINLFMQRSSNDAAEKPTSVKIQGATTADGEYTDIATLTTGLNNNLSYTAKVDLKASYSHIRVVNATANATMMALSEIYILPVDTKTEQAFTYFDKVQNDMVESLVYNRASAKQYELKVAEFNESFPEAKTLSGVPLPGNKYRIYADAFNGTSYVNKEISLGKVEGADTIVITPAGSYNGLSGDEAKKYEWYCEETVDGKLVFRNVYAASDGVEGDLYLANNGKVTDAPYKWSMSTVQTSRHGVPLWGENNKYLAIANNGRCWVPDVKAAQNQEVTSYTYQSAGTNTPDDTSDDAETTIEGGICTDFVFIPVEVLSTEKKITFTANEIVKRNTVFTFNGEEYKLPFSRMFTAGEDLPKITLKCEKIHSFKGVFEHKIVDEVLTKVDVTGTKARCENGVVSFDYDAINDADVLELKLTIGPPFENGTGSGNLYLIRNLRRKSVAQQAPSMPRRSATNVPVEGGQIATSEGEAYYAQFAGVNEDITLFTSSETVDFSKLKVEQFFYFHIDVDDIEEYYKVNIGNALTPKFCQSTNSWTSAGKTWYVQPNVVGGAAGYAIGLNVLDGTIYPAAPDGAWCSNHADGDKVVSYHVNDAGALWEFIPVPNDVAITKLKEYIEATSTAIQTTLQGYIDNTEDDGIDNLKSLEYKKYAALVVAEANAASDVTTLVGLSHDIHMLGHEIEYALIELPMVTDRAVVDNKDDYSHPNWYYIYNVESMYDNGTTPGLKSYAKFTQNNVHMALDSVLLEGGVLGLENMFYLEGTKITEKVADGYNKIEDNNLTIDEYLQVDIHNFMTHGNTLVSRNDTVLSKSDYYPGKGEQYIAQDLGLVNTKPWRITLEYDLENVSYNAYGTCLLAGSPAAFYGVGATDDNYEGRFQVYLKDDKSVVIKLNNSDDRYRFWHTQDKYSHLKVIITYNVNNVILEVINSDGSNGEDTPGGGPKTITDFTMKDIDKLSSALPANGAKITKLDVERIDAHRWLPEDDENADVALQSDTWYVLPSSNTTYPGYSIVAGGANDANFGWTNFEKSSADTEIFSASGNDKNSTWQFEKIVEFDAHADQILAMCDIKQCVIYNRELKELYEKIVKKVEKIKELKGATDENDAEEEEKLFNEVYELLLLYMEKSPILAKDLKAPKVGEIYTVRHSTDEFKDKGLAVHVAEDGACDTREVYSADVTFGDTNNDNNVTHGSEYTSRGAWVFEGTDADGDGFLDMDQPIYMKNLHTQCYLQVGSTVLVEEAENKSAVTLTPKGSCTAGIQTDGEYMQMVAEMTAAPATYKTISYTKSDKTDFTAVAEADVPGTIKDVIEKERLTNTIVYSRTISEISLDASGKITVTFKHTNGSHKLNILAVVLVKKEDGTIVQGDYHWGKAGGKHVNNIYQLHDVVADGDYNLICYVCQAREPGVGSTDEVDLAEGTITIDTEGFNKVNNEGTEETEWIIEEIPVEEKIFHTTTTYSAGFSSLMLGFNAAIPDGVKAFYPIAENDLADKHVTLHSYKKVLPALAPAILHNVPEGQSGVYKFYYTEEAPTAVTDKATAADDIIIDGALYRKVVQISSFDDANPSAYEQEIGEDVNVYMYLSNKTLPKMYWVYENYRADGTKTGNNDDGGHINVNANRAFLVIGKSKAKSIASLSMRFDNSPTTGIEDIYDDHRVQSISTAVKGIFDLQGRKLSEITAPGMYIVDGEKVLVE